MPKAAGRTRKRKKPEATDASGKPTYTCSCTGGCKGRMCNVSKALYLEHARFRDLDKTTGEDEDPPLISESQPVPQQPNNVHSNDPVSF